MTGAGGGADPGAQPEWRWDVALSFAGAQRDYVEQVARALQARRMRCFYDADEEIGLWGKNLAEELWAIYGEQAATVVVFISAEYAARDWTRLERRAALNRAVKERREYVLPARFDDTRLPGPLSDMVTIDLRIRTPQKFATMIADKLADLGIPAPAGDTGPEDVGRDDTGRDDTGSSSRGQPGDTSSTAPHASAPAPPPPSAPAPVPPSHLARALTGHDGGCSPPPASTRRRGCGTRPPARTCAP